MRALQTQNCKPASRKARPASAPSPGRAFFQAPRAPLLVAASSQEKSSVGMLWAAA